MSSRRSLTLALVAGWLLGCGGGGEGGGATEPTGPDQAGAHYARSITVVSGDNQTAVMGTAVPVSPVVRVMSERSRPLQGATLTFAPDGGRGVLDAQTAVTNDAGEATLPRWVAPLTSGSFAVVVSAAGASGSSVTARVNATVSDVSQQVATQSIGAAGGTMTVSSPASPLNGLTITVPPGALSSSNTFTISSRPARTPPNGLTTASPLIEIAGPTTLSDSVIAVRLPAIPGSGGVIRAFVVGPGNELIAVPTNTSDASSVTISLRGFTTPTGGTALSTVGTANAAGDDILKLEVHRLTIPTTGEHSSTFAMKLNNAEFRNLGSVWFDGGYCAGSTVLSGAWFARSGTQNLRAQFAPLIAKSDLQDWPLADQLNPAIRLASKLQERYGAGLKTVGWWKYHFGQTDRTVWENVVVQIYFSHQPVYLRVRTADDSSGHAVLAYKVDVGQGRIYVADPNFPEDQQRFIQYRTVAEFFDPFPSRQNAEESTLLFTKIQDATYLFREDAATINSIIDQYNTDGYRTEFPPVAGGIKLKSNVVRVAVDNSTSLSVQSRDQELRFVAQNMGEGKVYWFRRGDKAWEYSNADVLTNDDTVRIPLESGVNTIGLVLRKKVNNKFKWVDAKRLTVTRTLPSLKFIQQPENAPVNGSLGSVLIRLVDEDGNPVKEQRVLSIKLEGGTTGAVLSGTVNPTTDSEGRVLLSDLQVDRSGTAYSLSVSATNLPPVLSATFNVTEDASFSGRVIDGATQAGLSGATIEVTGEGGGLVPVFTTTTNNNGDWSLSGFTTGQFTIRASKSGYVSTTLVSQTLAAPSTVVEPIPLVRTNTPGGIAGSIRSASPAGLITASVTVELRAGMNQTTGPTIASGTTTSGAFIFTNVPTGTYTIVARASGYADGIRTGIVVGAGQTLAQQDVVMTTGYAGVARFVLTVSANRAGLDPQLSGPIPGSTDRFWVGWYSFTNNCTASPFACIDLPYYFPQPATITITQAFPGVYRYYVYNHSEREYPFTSTIGTTGAKVQVYIGNTLRATYYAPSGVGNAWEVFSWNGTTITPVNRLYGINGGVPKPP